MSALDEFQSNKDAEVIAPRDTAPGDSGADDPERKPTLRSSLIDRFTKSRVPMLVWRDWRFGAGAAAAKCRPAQAYRRTVVGHASRVDGD